MFYNYIRFGNVLEFGHNYLPEFMLAPDGQFSINYLVKNYNDMFWKMPEWTETGLSFSRFGNAFWLCNVIFIVLAVALIIRVVMLYKPIKKSERIEDCSEEEFISKKTGRKSLKSSNYAGCIILSILIIIHFITILMHKTLGAEQFGSRYTVDVMPAAIVLLGTLVLPLYKNSSTVFSRFFNYVLILCLVGGTALNVSAAYKLFSKEIIYNFSTVAYWKFAISESFLVFIINELLRYIRKNSKKKTLDSKETPKQSSDIN